MISPRPAIQKLPPYQLGGQAVAELEARGVTRIVRLNSNEGAYPPFPEALEAMRQAALELNRYPDPVGDPLRTRLAALFDVQPEQAIVDAGGSSLIYLLAATLLDPGDEVVYPWPSFPVYGTSSLIREARVVRVPLDGYAIDVDALLRAITPRTRIVYLCNPNNPTGTPIPREDLERCVAGLPEGVLAVIDEAYAEFVPPPEQTAGITYVRAGLPVLIIRTFSKVYGLAGARVGYAFGPASVVEAMRRAQAAYAVNAMALAAALASLGLNEQVAERVRQVADGRTRLSEGVRGLGLDHAPSASNFLFVNTGRDAGSIVNALKERGVLVRPGRTYDAPDHFRVTVGAAEENEAFLEALGDILKGNTRG